MKLSRSKNAKNTKAPKAKNTKAKATPAKAKTTKTTNPNPTRTGFRFAAIVDAELPHGRKIVEDWVASGLWFTGIQSVDMALGGEYRARGSKRIGAVRALIVGPCKGQDPTVSFVRGFEWEAGPNGPLFHVTFTKPGEENAKNDRSVARTMERFGGGGVYSWDHQADE